MKPQFPFPKTLHCIAIKAAVAVVAFSFLLLTAEASQAKLTITSKSFRTFDGAEGVAVNSATNEIYVAADTVRVIDGATNTVTGGIPFSQATDVAVNSKTNRVYVVGIFATLDVVDAASKTVVASVTLSNRTVVEKRSVAVNTATNKVYVSNPGNMNSPGSTVDVIDGATNTIIKTVSVGRVPGDVAVNPVTNRIYVTNITEGTLSVLDGITDEVVTTIRTGIASNVAVNSTTNTVYVATSNIIVINGETNRITTQVGPTGSVRAVTVNEKTNQIYAADLLSPATVSAIDGATNQVTATSGNLGFDYSTDIAVNENTNFVYVTGFDLSLGGFVSILQDDTVATTDTTPPTVALTSPTNGARLTSLSAVTGTAFDNRGGSGISRVALFLKRSSDGKYWTGKNWSRTQTELRTTLGAFGTNGQSFSNADPLPSGENLKQDTYFLTAVAIDRANARGNRAVTTVSFRVIDVIDPQIAITYPSDGAMLSQLTKISGTLTDNRGGSGPSRVLLQIRRSSDRKYFDGTMWTSSPVTLSTELIGSGEAVAWQRIGGLPPVVSGRDVYTISAIGYDRAFNRDDATVTITVGTAATAT